MSERNRIAVIGAGASGMTAAITAARLGGEVTLFEKNDRVGKKILSTGNGKCNLGNTDFSIEKYYCEDRDKEKLRKMFQVFSVWDTISFFESMGLMIREKDGYLYPYSEQASSVLDVLRMELVRKNVTVITGTEIREAGFDQERGEFELSCAEGKTWRFEKLIISCGSPASLKKGEGHGGYELAGKFGHMTGKMVPGLVQLKSDEPFIRGLSGVRVKAGVSLVVEGEERARESGEIQFTDYGVSGIPVFQISRVAAFALEEGKDVRILVDFFPDQEQRPFSWQNRVRYETQADKTLEDYMTGMLNKKINMALIRRAGLKPGIRASEAGWEKIREMMSLCRSLEIHISGVNSMENAQICAGGVLLDGLSTELESERVKGLYFAGEMLDVDGKCGGYNLQWAFTSGYIAGSAAAGCNVREIFPDPAENPQEEEEEHSRIRIMEKADSREGNTIC